jgi:hypothetical protein
LDLISSRRACLSKYLLLVSGFSGLAYYSTSLVLNSLTSKVHLFSLAQKHAISRTKTKEGLHNNKRSVNNEETSRCFLFFLQFQNVPIAKPWIEIEGTLVSTELLGHLIKFSNIPVIPSQDAGHPGNRPPQANPDCPAVLLFLALRHNKHKCKFVLFY